MRLIVVRHGETEENKKGLMQGHTPGTLSELGKKQARTLGEKLANEKIDAIYSSDLARAYDTAKIIAKNLPGIPLITDEALREIDCSPYTGGKDAEIDWNNRPPEMESRIQIMKRIRKFLARIQKQHPNESLLIVTHCGTMKAINRVVNKLSHHERLDNNDYTKPEIWEI